MLIPQTATCCHFQSSKTTLSRAVRLNEPNELSNIQFYMLASGRNNLVWISVFGPQIKAKFEIERQPVTEAHSNSSGRVDLSWATEALKLEQLTVDRD